MTEARTRREVIARCLAAGAFAAFAGGCASSYQLTLMPRDSGKIYHGTAEDSGGGEATLSVTLEGRTYAGTWVEVVSDRSGGHVSAGFGSRRFWGFGTIVSLDNPRGVETKALLRSSDGAGLRCDFRGSGGSGRSGGGVCRDDSGLEYDVQIRPARQP